LILDFWYPGPSYLVQEVLVHYFVCIWCPVHKNALKNTQFSRCMTTFLTILQFSTELNKNWDTVLASLCLHEFIVL
jgi:hypothetical protein